MIKIIHRLAVLGITGLPLATSMIYAFYITMLDKTYVTEVCKTSFFCTGFISARIVKFAVFCSIMPVAYAGFNRRDATTWIETLIERKRNFFDIIICIISLFY